MRQRRETSLACQKPVWRLRPLSSQQTPPRPPKPRKPLENMPPTRLAIDCATSPLLGPPTPRALKKLTGRGAAPSDGPKASRFQNGTVPIDGEWRSSCSSKSGDRMVRERRKKALSRANSGNELL